LELKFQGIECLGVELSDAQRVFALAQLEASVTTKEIAATLGCSSRCIQKTVTRWKETSSTTSRRRSDYFDTVSNAHSEASLVKVIGIFVLDAVLSFDILY